MEMVDIVPCISGQPEQEVDGTKFRVIQQQIYTEALKEQIGLKLKAYV